MKLSRENLRPLAQTKSLQLCLKLVQGGIMLQAAPVSGVSVGDGEWQLQLQLNYDCRNAFNQVEGVPNMQLLIPKDNAKKPDNFEKFSRFFPGPYFLTLKLHDLLYPPARQADKEVKTGLRRVERGPGETGRNFPEKFLSVSPGTI